MRSAKWRTAFISAGAQGAVLLVDVVDKCSPNYLTVIEITEPALIDKAAKL